MSEQDYEQLTLFPEDSPASHSVWLESKKVKGTTVTSGLRCSELSESCARIASSVRTYLESSRLPPGRWSRIWSTLAITSSCSIMKLRLSELGTEEAGSSLWAMPNVETNGLIGTPTANMRVRSEAYRAGRTPTPAELVRLLPTPCAMDAATERMKSTQQKGYGRHSLNLPAAVKLYTTPCAADSQGSTGGNNHRSLRTDVAGQLNPTWVEWLMGFPIGWTDLNA